MKRIGENSLNKWPEQRKLLAMAAQLIRNYRGDGGCSKPQGRRDRLTQGNEFFYRRD